MNLGFPARSVSFPSGTASRGRSLCHKLSRHFAVRNVPSRKSAQRGQRFATQASPVDKINQFLEDAWESTRKRVQEINSQLGVSRKTRQMYEDFVRTWPSTRSQIVSFVSSPLGKVALFAAVYWVVQTGTIWSLLTWMAMAYFVGPPLAYLALAYTARAKGGAGSAAAQAGGPQGPFNAPRGGPSGFKGSPENLADLIAELQRQQAAAAAGRSGRAGGAGSAGGSQKSSRSRFDDDGPIIDAQFTEVKK